MFKKNNNTFKQDPYHTRKERISFLNKPDTVFARSWLCGLVVLGCVFVDLLCLKVIWNLVQTENPLFVWSIAAACVACFAASRSASRQTNFQLFSAQCFSKLLCNCTPNGVIFVCDRHAPITFSYPSRFRSRPQPHISRNSAHSNRKRERFILQSPFSFATVCL